MSEKVIRDPIHGNIRLDGAYIGLVDTPQFQRLRWIKQNGVCYLVYPAMNSTRFEHSLGVYHLGGLIARQLRLPEPDGLELRAACLLHDIGHGPFSHTFDCLMAAHGLDHERESERLILGGAIADTLKAAGINPVRVAEIIRGKGRLGKLLSSEVDVDKMDYLVRDAYYAGVAYGVTDVERLLYSISMEKGDVVVEEGGLEAAESLLINRNMMYQTVYRHHTKRIAESMLAHAVESIIDAGTDAREVFSMDDASLICTLRRAEGYAGDMGGRVERRRLFKSVFSEGISILTEDSRAELSENHGEVERNIAGDYGIEKGYLLLDYPETSMNEYRVKVRTAHGLRSIGEVSPLAKSLEGSEREKLTVSLYARPEDRGIFRKFKPEDYFSYQQKRISGYL